MPDGIYKRGRIWWGRKQLTKREIRRSLRTPNKAEARRRYEDWVARLETEAWSGEPQFLWKEAVAHWMAEYLPYSVKPSVAKRYFSSIMMLDPLLHDVPLKSVDRKTIAAVISGRRKHVTNATIKRDITAMSSVLRYSVSQGWCDTNAAHEFDTSIIREQRDPISLPTDKGIEMIIGRVPFMIAQMCRLALQTGMRGSEVTQLRWTEIDLDRPAINLTKTKNRRARTIPLDDSITVQAVGTITGTPRHMNSPFVFWHDDGEPYRNLPTNFSKVARKKEYKDPDKPDRPKYPNRFHDFRHRFAVDYLKAGGYIYDLQKILGHRSLTTTEIYLDFLTPEEQQQARRPAQK